jgi:hypothetical protein
MKSSPSAASRPAWQRTPSLAARVTTIDRRVRTQAGLPQPSGSRFQTRWFLRPLLWCCHETVPEPFSYLARRFLHAQDRRCIHISTQGLSNMFPKGGHPQFKSAHPQYCGLPNRLRTKKSCGAAVADLHNLTFAIPQLSAVSCQFRYI